jgi:hypothetical protein
VQKSVTAAVWRCARAAHQVTEFLFFVESERNGDRSVWRTRRAVGWDPGVLSGLKPRGATRDWRVGWDGAGGGGGTKKRSTLPVDNFKYTQHRRKAAIVTLSPRVSYCWNVGELVAQR